MNKDLIVLKGNKGAGMMLMPNSLEVQVKLQAYHGSGVRFIRCQSGVCILTVPFTFNPIQFREVRTSVKEILLEMFPNAQISISRFID